MAKDTKKVEHPHLSFWRWLFSSVMSWLLDWRVIIALSVILLASVIALAFFVPFMAPLAAGVTLISLKIAGIVSITLLGHAQIIAFSVLLAAVVGGSAGLLIALGKHYMVALYTISAETSDYYNNGKKDSKENTKGNMLESVCCALEEQVVEDAVYFYKGMLFFHDVFSVGCSARDGDNERHYAACRLT